MMNAREILLLSSFLFCAGMYGVLTRRNIVGILMSMELMFNSACMNFIVFARCLNPLSPAGDVFVVFIVAVAAAEIAVAFAIVMCIYRDKKTANIEDINLMKG